MTNLYLVISGLVLIQKQHSRGDWMIEKQNEGPSEEPTNPDTTSSPVDIIKPKPKKKNLQ